MNKKGIIALVVVIILVVIGYAVWGGRGASNVPVAPSTATTTVSVPAGVTASTFAPVTSATTDTTLLGRLKNSSVAASETGTRVALVNGKANFNASGVSGSLALGTIAVEQSMNGQNYAVTTLGVTMGGHTYQYAVLFTDNGTSLSDTSYDLIGEDATITGLRADTVSGGFVVTATYTDASGASHHKIMVVENGAFDAAKDINL